MGKESFIPRDVGATIYGSLVPPKETIMFIAGDNVKNVVTKINLRLGFKENCEDKGVKEPIMFLDRKDVIFIYEM